MRGEKKAYSRTTAGTVSNNVRCALHTDWRNPPALFYMSNHRNSRGGKLATHLSDTVFLQTCLQSSDLYRLPFKPHTKPSAPFHTFGLRATTSDLPKIASAGPQVQQAATSEEPQIVGTRGT